LLGCVFQVCKFEFSKFTKNFYKIEFSFEAYGADTLKKSDSGSIEKSIKTLFEPSASNATKAADESTEESTEESDEEDLLANDAASTKKNDEAKASVQTPISPSNKTASSNNTVAFSKETLLSNGTATFNGTAILIEAPGAKGSSESDDIDDSKKPDENDGGIFDTISNFFKGIKDFFS
jgi:hypothetical protein